MKLNFSISSPCWQSVIQMYKSKKFSSIELLHDHILGIVITVRGFVISLIFLSHVAVFYHFKSRFYSGNLKKCKSVDMVVWLAGEHPGHVVLDQDVEVTERHQTHADLSPSPEAVSSIDHPAYQLP